MSGERIRVGDVMRNDFGTVDGMATVSQAIALMQESDSRCLVVNKRDEHDEYGIILVSDIARKVVAPNLSPERINVYEIMAKPVVSVHPGMRIHHCAQLFDRFGLSRAPVIDASGNVVGVVSYSHLVLSGLCQDL